MTLDLSNPDHEAALVDACAISRSATSIKVIAANPSILDTRPLVAKALANLSSPASAAELVRQLVERAGLTVCGYHSQRRGAFVSMQHDDIYIFVEIVNHFAGQVPSGYTYKSADFAPLIARLLALTHGAGAEAVLEALRGGA